MSTQSLPIFKDFNPRTTVLLKELTESLQTQETEMALVAKMGVERGLAFVNYARDQNLVALVKVFNVKPIGQYKPIHREGPGTQMFDADTIELALMTAFSFVYHQQSKKKP